MALLAALSSAAVAAPDPKPDSKKLTPPEIIQGLGAIQEAQRALSVSVAELRVSESDLQRALGELREDLGKRDAAMSNATETTVQQIKELREEVRGLYVESSGLKGDIAQSGKLVETLEQEITSFRLSYGIIAALIIVLQVVLIGLTFRNRA